MSRSNRVAKNVSTTLITQGITWLLASAVVLFLPRYTGAAGLGKITLAGAFAGICGLLSSLGIGTVILRDISRDKEKTGSLIAASLLVRLPLAVLSVVLGLVIGAILGYSHQVLLFIGIALVGTTVGVIADTMNSAIRGLETFSIANIGSLIDKCVGSALTIIICVLKGPYWMIIASSVLSTSMSAYYMFSTLKNTGIKLSVPSKADLILLVRAGVPFLSAGVFSAIYARSDIIFLSKLSSADSMGWYSLAIKLSGAAMAVPATLCSAMLPTMSALFKEQLESFVDSAYRLVNLMVICCVPVAATMIFCPTPLVGLFSGHVASFIHATPVVQVYGVAVILYFLSQGAATAVIACDQEKVFSRAMSIAAIFSIPLTAICIIFTEKTMHNGAVGAAVSDLLAELYLLACYIKVLPTGAVTWSLVVTALRATVAALPLMAEFYVVPTRFVLFAAVPCLAIYGYLCIRLGCLDKKEVEMLSSTFNRKFRARS